MFGGTKTFGERGDFETTPSGIFFVRDEITKWRKL